MLKEWSVIDWRLLFPYYSTPTIIMLVLSRSCFSGALGLMVMIIVGYDFD